jgi:hypothetical protein
VIKYPFAIRPICAQIIATILEMVDEEDFIRELSDPVNFELCTPTPFKFETPA